MQETQEKQVQSIGWEDPLQEGTMTHSGPLAWLIPGTEQPCVHGVTKESNMTKPLTSNNKLPNILSLLISI